MKFDKSHYGWRWSSCAHNLNSSYFSWYQLRARFRRFNAMFFLSLLLRLPLRCCWDFSPSIWVLCSLFDTKWKLGGQIWQKLACAQRELIGIEFGVNGAGGEKQLREENGGKKLRGGKRERVSGKLDGEKWNEYKKVLCRWTTFEGNSIRSKSSSFCVLMIHKCDSFLFQIDGISLFARCSTLWVGGKARWRSTNKRTREIINGFIFNKTSKSLDSMLLEFAKNVKFLLVATSSSRLGVLCLKFIELNKSFRSGRWGGLRTNAQHSQGRKEKRKKQCIDEL